MSKDENWLIFPSANVPHLNSGCQAFRGLFLGILVDNHRNVWLSFRRQKYNIENAKSSIWRDFFKKEQISSFKKSEAPNLLIINPNFWFFFLIFNIQKNQDPRRKEIVYRRKTWRRIKKKLLMFSDFLFKFPHLCAGEIKIRRRVFIFCEGELPILQPPVGWFFRTIKFRWKSQELALLIKLLRDTDFLKDSFARFLFI